LQLTFAPLLQAENLMALDQISGDKMVYLRSVFDRLSEGDHPVQLNCDRLRELDVVRLIEGKS
jgi:hypothetical protein